MEFPIRLTKLRKSLGQTQEEMAARLGVSGNWISLLEGGKKEPGDALMRHVELLERALDSGLFADEIPTKPTLKRQPVRSIEEMLGVETLPAKPSKTIQVIGWAHAGEAENYEELPQSWQDQIPTHCRDRKAFAVRLVGDSMEPLYYEGDLLILMPTKEIYNGCLAVVRLANDGVTFRRIELRGGGETIRLVPLNPRYEHQDLKREEISWAYPLFGMFRQVCKS
jgi:SOS-response transcriptional repressor LexA